MAAMADDDMVVKAGPFDMPQDGQNGTVAWAERQEILGLTGVSAAVRDRKNTHGKRHLTLSGPMSGMELAKKMAWQYVVNSQRRQDDFQETPGSAKDWIATERHQKRESAASSSSWQAMPMQAMPMQAMPMQAMQPMHVMPMQGMLQQAILQPFQLLLHGMLQQQQHAMMQPMFVRQGGSCEVVHSDADDEVGTAEIKPKNEEHSDADDEEVEPTQKFAAPPLASPARMPANKFMMAATSKSRAPAPPTCLVQAKAAPPTAEKLAALKKELMEIGLKGPLRGQKNTAAMKDEHMAKDAGDQHLANPLEVDDDDDDAHDIDDGPANNAAILASRRTVQANKIRKLIYIRQDPTMKYVNIMTVGWRQQGVPYTKDFKELVEGKQGLIWRLVLRGLPEPDVVVDCRPLKRYDFDKAILRHTGHHAEIVYQTVEHRLFKATMQAALDNIREVFDEGNGANVLVVCTSGCHRSVSFALVMEYILKQLLYHTQVRHLSEGSWRPRGLCMSCTACDEDNESKLKNFEMAARKMTEW